MTNQKQFTITKKIAKHGDQAIVAIPRLVESSLTPGTVVQVTFDVLETKEETEDG